MNSIDKFIANILTMINLALGAAAIICITSQLYIWGAVLILLAGIMDGLDGKAARYFNTTSEMGKNLDSLSDLVSFGIAPSLLIFSQIKNDTFFILAAIVFIIYICCGAYRLARFNTLNITTHFMGLPITAAGMLVALLSLLSFTNSAMLAVFITLLLAFLMISNIKVPKF